MKIKQKKEIINKAETKVKKKISDRKSPIDIKDKFYKKIELENKCLVNALDINLTKIAENNQINYKFIKNNITLLSAKFNEGESIISCEMTGQLPISVSFSQRHILNSIINETLNSKLRDTEKLFLDDNNIIFTRTIYLKKKLSLQDSRNYLLALQDTINASHFYALIIEREFITYLHVLTN